MFKVFFPPISMRPIYQNPTTKKITRRLRPISVMNMDTKILNKKLTENSNIKENYIP